MRFYSLFVIVVVMRCNRMPNLFFFIVSRNIVENVNVKAYERTHTCLTNFQESLFVHLKQMEMSSQNKIVYF